MANEYTPTVWRTGDVITAEKLNKIEEGIANAGQPSWETVFDGSVTTAKEMEEDTSAGAVITGLSPITENEIKVTFNNVEYICEKNTDGGYGAIYDPSTNTFDWSEYPFYIIKPPFGNDTMLMTETAGTYSLKIEAPESSGGEFSIATVVITNETESLHTCIVPYIVEEDQIINTLRDIASMETVTVQVPVYGYGTSFEMDSSYEDNLSVSGAIEPPPIPIPACTIKGDGSITLLPSHN